MENSLDACLSLLEIICMNLADLEECAQSQITLISENRLADVSELFVKRSRILRETESVWEHLQMSLEVYPEYLENTTFKNKFESARCLFDAFDNTESRMQQSIDEKLGMLSTHLLEFRATKQAKEIYNKVDGESGPVARIFKGSSRYFNDIG